MENVKVAIWGFGAMGSGMAKMLLNKKGVEIVGVCDMAETRKNRSIYEVLGVEKGERPEVIIKDDINEVLKEGCCDICLCATDSFTKKAFPKLKLVLEKKINEQIEINKAILLTVHSVSHQMHIDENGRTFYSAVVHFKAK